MSEPPWRGPHYPTSDEYAFFIDMAAASRSGLQGRFDANLWGLAITPDYAARLVHFEFSFEHEPSVLDRFEMGEFYDTFAEKTLDWIDWRHRRIVAPRADLRIDRTDPRRWIHLTRDPTVGAPDGIEPQEIDY
ncbi:MAG: hypothetical protein R8F63_21880 [Acidimicrobiales bacterium]|nr:hypothetical protein [Acidimicrobiales bacterium]